jgi:poly(beta-D-mannuronate) lyase
VRRTTSILGALALACGGASGDPATDETSTAPATGDTGGPSTTLDDSPTGDAPTGTTSTTGTTGTSDETGTTGETGDSSGDSSGASESTGAPAQLPAEVLDLLDWKLTLPVAGDAPDEPREVLQPELASFTLDPWFVVAGGGVRFRADAGGVTTSNSGYPRSELREMTGGGLEPAAWSTTEGVHTLTITQAITHLPDVKPHVVAGQIHDAGDDVVMIRLEDTYLFVEGGGDELGVLDPDYQLGDEFTVRLRAGGGTIDIYYEDLGTPAVSVARDAAGCYFKAGVYTQSNPDKGDDPAAYGEVVISALSVTHE